MNNYLHFLKDRKANQKGVALLVTFFVMGIAVTMVLGVSIILLSELKMVRNIGGSVVSFYVADTGLETTLYYDRKVVEAGLTRGICDICESCGSTCQDCSAAGGNDCVPSSCTDCHIQFKTDINGKVFRLSVMVTSAGDIYKSYGTYRGITRAIQISGD